MLDEIPIYTLGNLTPVGTVQVVSGILNINKIPAWAPAASGSYAKLDERLIKEQYNNMGSKVLRHINAHETAELGKLSEIVRERIQYIKDTASFTNAQWRAFAELTQSINDMIGDPYDPRSVEPD